MKRVNLRINDSMYNQLSNFAKANEVSFSTAIRHAVTEFFNEDSSKESTSESELMANQMERMSSSIENKLNFIKEALIIVSKSNAKHYCEIENLKNRLD